MIDFTRIEYLKLGNLRQQRAYQEILQLKIFESLEKYSPILAGTIPIEIDLPNSDLDIICACKDHDEFSSLLTQLYGNQENFNIKTVFINGTLSTISQFKTDHFEFEIFGQNIPTIEQNAYRHMLIEYEVLNRKGEQFRTEIKRLKEQGLKTEPAFAQLLGIKGDPYQGLLQWKQNFIPE